MKKDIISLIFEKKEDDELFYFNCEEKSKCEDSKNRISKELFDFIEERVHQKSKMKLKILIEKYIDAMIEYCYIENKMYYKEGFKDGISIMNKK